MAPSPLRVLHVFRTYIPDTKGGAQEVIRQISGATGRLGVENRVFTPSANPQPREVEVNGATVVRVKLNLEIASCGFCFTGLGEFKRQVDWADIVHYHFPWPFADVMHYACGVDKPTLMTYHADILRSPTLFRLYSPLMHRFLDAMDHIVSTSEIYRDSSPYLSTRLAKTSIIPIGLDEGSYPPVDNDLLEATRDQYGEDFFLFVGMLRHYKGLHVLLDACEGQSFKVLVAGQGPLEQELKRQAADLGLTNLVFAGEVTDETKVAMLSLCRAIVFPSHSRAEAFGVTLLEGMMFSKPLITAEMGSGTSHVNCAGETGLIVPAEDPDALAGAIIELEGDDALAKKLGEGARARFEALFTADAMGRQYLDQYELLQSS